MLVSTLEGKHSHRFQCSDSSSLENHLGLKLPKFSLNMKNYCSIHLRLLHNLNEDRRHDIFMLNPECHLKFLEENLNFLSRKPSRCNNFKISSSKSSSYSVETSQKVLSLPETRLPSLTFTSLSDNSVSQMKTIKRDFDDGSSRDTVIFDRSKIKVSNVFLQKRPLDKPSLATPPIIKIKEKYSSKKEKCHEFQSNLKFKPITTDKALESLKNKNDSDTQFEFTVAGEKIVSFVCSPPASRRPKTKENESNYICDSDEESVVSLSKTSSDSASNSSSKSSYSRYMKRKEALPVREHVINTNMLLWHPPSTPKNVVSQSESKSIYNCTSFSQQIEQKPSENSINFFGPINSLYAVASDRNFKNSHNQETVMFREAALRGCYEIETLLNEVKSQLPEVEKEVNQTREAIFSAVRLQTDNASIVSDSILSIIDICNSWIKLNAHFERKDFIHFLEHNGIDLTVLEDFAQWQCMSRIFVDKLINVLKKVSIGKTSKTTSQRDSLPTRGSVVAARHSNLASRCETTSNNIPHVFPNLNISQPATDPQSKRWKQRRFLSEKIDSEKVALTNNRSCKSHLLGNNSFPLLVNNCNAETVFGQGDNELNFSREFSKITPLFSTKNYQSAQAGDMNLLLSGPKPLNFSNSGFFDKNISVPNTKCCSVRGETGCPVTPTNDLCTSITNLVDVPLNNYFPVNIQQAVPTVPPLYNDPLCLFNSNQYPPSFNHCLAKPNPIYCMDTDVGENFLHSSYIKPGLYPPPQKAAAFQKAQNNSYPINDIPTMGIPFFFSAPFTSLQQPKSLECPNSHLQIQTSKDNPQNKDSDDTWKTALSMAGHFRDTMMADRVDESLNLKSSETVSLQSHFLLADDKSQNSSSSGDNLKVNCDSDALSFPIHNSPGKDLPVMKSKTKTTDWLIESFNKISLENDSSLRSSIENGDIHSENEQAEVSQPSEESSKKEGKESYFSSSYLTNTYNGCGTIKDNNIYAKHEDIIISPFLKSETGYLQKKPRKNKKSRDDYTLFDRKHIMLYNKPDTRVFKRSMNNKITSQLEDILNCIWNTKVSTLIEEEIKPEKELAKLELKVRSPLYLQAMRCKLSNHSYDTLDQALSDFQQYFVDIRNKNKGDKQCIEVVGALERIFFGLVEQYFGLTYQPPPQYTNQVSMTPATKSRRQKKTPRRV